MSSPLVVKAPLPVQEKLSDGIGKRFDTATKALRGLGAVLLLASASSFLVQRWDAGNDLLRFAFLVAHTVVLMGCAYFCGGKLGESRSARLFLWTSLAMVPVHFGVLGGLVYSQFALDAPSQLLPSYAVWEAPSKLGALLCLVGTCFAVIPSSFISTRVLARRQAGFITTCYLGLCSLLLIPVRSADWVGVAAVAGAVVALFAERKRFCTDYTMRTFEGRLVRSLLWVPLALVVGRTAIYYPTTEVFLGLLVAAAGICAVVVSRSIEERAHVEAIEWLSSLVIAYGVFLTLEGLGAYARWSVLPFLGTSITFLVMSFTSRLGKSGFEQAAALSAVGTCAVSLLFNAQLGEGAIAIVIGTTALTSSILMSRGIIGTLSGLLTLGGIVVVFERAIGFDKLANWATLSGLGVFIVLAAAYVERNRDRIVRWAEKRGLDASNSEESEVKLSADSGAQVSLP